MGNRVSSLTELLKQMSIIDLSHTLQDDMPVYPAHSRYFHTLWDSLETGSMAVVYQLVINEHCGTHIDATGHFLASSHPKHQWMAETPLASCHSRACTLDFSYFFDRDLISAQDIQRWEEMNFNIEENDIVMFHFGWDRYWQPRSTNRIYSEKWPGLSSEAADYLANKKIKAVGCDTLAIDSSYSADCPAHYTLLGNGILIIENLTNLAQIIGESYVFAFPLKIKEGSASPIRAVAFK